MHNKMVVTSNNITSLFVSGIHPGTYEQYIYNIFSKLGKVYKINYNIHNTTAHVHIHHWYDKNPKIKTLMDRIKSGETVPIVHNVIDYWSVGLFQSNANGRKNVATMKDLHIFAEKFGFNLGSSVTPLGSSVTPLESRSDTTPSPSRTNENIVNKEQDK